MKQAVMTDVFDLLNAFNVACDEILTMTTKSDLPGRGFRWLNYGYKESGVMSEPGDSLVIAWW